MPETPRLAHLRDGAYTAAHVQALRPLALAFFGLGSLAACGEDERRLREWRAEDHAQPAQPDPARQAPESEPEPLTEARVAAQLWQLQCATCHGVEGLGNGPGAPPVAQMPNLTTAAYQDDRTDAQIAQVIQHGQGMMPAFPNLPDRAVQVLIAHVRSLRRED